VRYYRPHPLKDAPAGDGRFYPPTPNGLRTSKMTPACDKARRGNTYGENVLISTISNYISLIPYSLVSLPYARDGG